MRSWCAAGIMNLPRIKGSHNAILSEIAATDEITAALAAGREHDEPTSYEDGWCSSLIGKDLKRDALKQGLLEIEIGGQHDHVPNRHAARPRQHERYHVGHFAGLQQTSRLPGFFQFLRRPVGE